MGDRYDPKTRASLAKAHCTVLQDKGPLESVGLYQ